MGNDTNRLLLVWEKTLRDINRAVINPAFEELSIEDVKPVLDLVARARADYLKELFDIAGEFKDDLPPAERISQLSRHRERYEEQVSASKALEAAVQRQYLDVDT